MPRRILDYDFGNSLGAWICRSSHSFERALNEQLEPHGITWSQCRVLGLLAERGELAQAEIAHRMGIEAPTLVGILDRMERSGWIERTPDPSDRRRKLVHPMPRVKPVWRRIVACARRVRSRAARDIPILELRRLKNTLAAIESNLTATKGATER